MAKTDVPGATNMTVEEPEESGAGALRSLRVEVAANGFTVQCDYAPKGKPGGAPPSYATPELKVFTDAQAVADYVLGELGGGGSEDE